MAKSYSIAFVSMFLMLFNSCQSLEQFSISYLKPGEISFPAQLRKVAIVNNSSTIPDNKLLTEAEKPKENNPLVYKATAYANGDTKIAIESLAKEIANQNYFDEVVICDSALRANDKFPRENTLSQDEVRQLTSDLGVDFIIALENLQIKATKTVLYMKNSDCYEGTVDAKIFPTIRIYVPSRSGPLTTLLPKDSIFWQEYGGSAEMIKRVLVSDTQMLKESAEFAGTIPVKYLTPYWTTGERYIFTGGSPAMRDAAIYVRENSWDKAYELWNQVYESTKSKKKKMQTAFNIALYYEMKDSIPRAQEWAAKAQEIAMKIDKIEEQPQKGPVLIGNIPNYYLTAFYINELKERNKTFPKVNMQMNRFNDDF